MAWQREGSSSSMLRRSSRDESLLSCAIVTVAPGETTTNQLSYRCDFCHFATADKELLSLHINDHFFRCSLCSFYTTRQHKLFNHCRRQHGRPFPLPYDLVSLDEHALSTNGPHKSVPLLTLGAYHISNLHRQNCVVPKDAYVTDTTDDAVHEVGPFPPVNSCTAEVSQASYEVQTATSASTSNLVNERVSAPCTQSAAALTKVKVKKPKVKSTVKLRLVKKLPQLRSAVESQSLRIARHSLGQLHSLTSSLKLLSSYMDSDEREVSVSPTVAIGRELSAADITHDKQFCVAKSMNTTLFSANRLARVTLAVALVSTNDECLQTVTNTPGPIHAQALVTCLSAPFAVSDKSVVSCLVMPSVDSHPLNSVQALQSTSQSNCHGIKSHTALLKSQMSSVEILETAVMSGQLETITCCHQVKNPLESITEQCSVVHKSAVSTDVLAEPKVLENAHQDQLSTHSDLNPLQRSHGCAKGVNAVGEDKATLLPTDLESALSSACTDAHTMPDDVITSRRCLRILPSRQAASSIAKRKTTSATSSVTNEPTPESKPLEPGPATLKSNGLRRTRRASGIKTCTVPTTTSLTTDLPVSSFDHYTFVESNEELSKDHWNSSIGSRPNSCNSFRDEEPLVKEPCSRSATPSSASSESDAVACSTKRRNRCAAVAKVGKVGRPAGRGKAKMVKRIHFNPNNLFSENTVPFPKQQKDLLELESHIKDQLQLEAKTEPSEVKPTVHCKVEENLLQVASVTEKLRETFSHKPGRAAKSPSIDCDEESSSSSGSIGSDHNVPSSAGSSNIANSSSTVVPATRRRRAVTADSPRRKGPTRGLALIKHALHGLMHQTARINRSRHSVPPVDQNFFAGLSDGNKFPDLIPKNGDCSQSISPVKRLPLQHEQVLFEKVELGQVEGVIEPVQCVSRASTTCNSEASESSSPSRPRITLCRTYSHGRNRQRHRDRKHAVKAYYTVNKVVLDTGTALQDVPVNHLSVLEQPNVLTSAQEVLSVPVSSLAGCELVVDPRLVTVTSLSIPLETVIAACCHEVVHAVVPTLVTSPDQSCAVITFSSSILSPESVEAPTTSAVSISHQLPYRLHAVTLEGKHYRTLEGATLGVESQQSYVSTSPSSPSCDKTLEKGGRVSNETTLYQLVDEVLSTGSERAESLTWDTATELSELGTNGSQLNSASFAALDDIDLFDCDTDAESQADECTASSSPEVLIDELTVVQANVAPVIVQAEQCMTSLQASFTCRPGKSQNDEGKDGLASCLTNEPPLKSGVSNKCVEGSFRSLKSRLQLAVQKGALNKKTEPGEDKTRVSKSKHRKSSSSRSCGHTKSDDSSSKSKKDKKLKKKHKRKHKEPKLPQDKPASPAKINTLTSKQCKPSKSSAPKKHKRESVSLEDSLIFYPVPSDTNELQQSKSATKASSSSVKADHANSTMTVSQEKKRKSVGPTDQPKRKKNKPSKCSKVSTKPNEHTEDKVTCQSSQPSKLPWCNGTITDVLRCDLCDFICLEKHDLIEHNHEVHAAKNRLATLAPCDYDPAIDQNVVYKCTLCGLADDRLKRIRSHITHHHGGKLQSCERVTHTRDENGFSLLVESVRVYKH